MKDDCLKIPNWIVGLLVGVLGSFVGCVFIGGMLVQSLNDIKKNTKIIPIMSQSIAIHDVKIEALQKETDKNSVSIIAIKDDVIRLKGILKP